MRWGGGWDEKDYFGGILWMDRGPEGGGGRGGGVWTFIGIGK